MEGTSINSSEDVQHRVPENRRAGASLPGLTKALALGTLILVLLGANVTSTESGMADEHWPSFDGHLLPSLTAMRADLGKLYEHTHRLFAGGILLFTWILAAIMKFFESRRWVRRLVWTSAGVILLPALLGGLTVLYNTPPELSVLHVGLAMLVLSLNTALAIVTGKGWEHDAPASPLGHEETGWLRVGALFCLLSLYLQIILGAVLRHAGYGVLPHILWAFMVFTIIVMVTSRVFARHGRIAPLLYVSVLLVFLLVAQFFLGFTAYVSGPDEVDAAGSDLHQLIATLHQVVGALMLMASVAFLLRVLRIRYLESQSLASPGESALSNAGRVATEGETA